MELWSLIDVNSGAILVQRRIIVRFGVVVDLTEVTDPPASVVDELDKGIYVGATFFASYNCLLVEIS